MTTEQLQRWQIKSIKPSTKRLVRIYAAENDLSIGQALDEIVARVVER